MPRASRCWILAFCATAALWAAPLVAQRAPDPVDVYSDLVFPTMADGTPRLDDFRGRVVLVDIWATWCAPCLAEFPRLKQLRRDHGPDDFVLIGVSLDTMEQRRLRAWLRRNAIEWPQVHDGRAYNGDLARRLAVEELPATLLFDRQGRLAYRNLRGPALARAITDLLRAPSADHQAPIP